MKEQSEQLEAKLKEQGGKLEAKLNDHSEKQSEQIQEAVRQLSQCHKVYSPVLLFQLSYTCPDICIHAARWKTSCCLSESTKS